MGRTIFVVKGRLLIINKLKVILQGVLVAIPLIISMVLPVDLLWEVFGLVADRNFGGIKNQIYEIVPNKKIIALFIGLILSIVVLILFRFFNKDKIFNVGNKHFDFHMNYFILSRFLGYKKITLVGIPLYLQFKLLFKETFECSNSDSHPEEIDEPKIITQNIDDKGDEINLILSDTYLIKLDDLPDDKMNLPTLIIERTNGFSGVRTYNRKFVEGVRKQTHEYHLKYKRVNVFATTNTQNTKEIVLQSFKNRGRTGFKEIHVYVQNSDRKFQRSHLIR
ncbi:hypothetical protein DV702_05395 [Sporosarcina sp. PTS2304]|uniref:hypothetical protein n=1 Tax=Sporosarcina sp. PTS2304 TaxID=2283194 RepID=UPI000E0CCB84|nr:hypothetical protein [Sporosarcina sp. PTS2304]AXH99221.1 hypothetical protein DV702_05395 [Sporosarcina sp. PTS2304]